MVSPSLGILKLNLGNHTMTKKLLIIAEKPDLAKSYLNDSNNLTSNYDIDIISFHGMGLFRFSYPKNLPISEAPKIIPIQWRLLDFKELDYYKNHKDDLNLSWTNFAYNYSTIENGMSPKRKPLKENLDTIELQLMHLRDNLIDYSEIKILPDPDHRGMYFGYQLTNYLIKNTSFPLSNISLSLIHI